MRLQRVRDNALGRPPGAPAPPDEEDNEPIGPSAGNISRQNISSEKSAMIGDTNEMNCNKKRKAESKDKDEDSRNKKSRLSDIAPSTRNDDETEPSARPIVSVVVAQSNGDLSREATVDEDEYAAFEREIAIPPPTPDALTAPATIVAAPLSAAELAAKAREEVQVTGKERREAEIEAEKEDAARQMEEELEEMAELEERVRRLREKREQIRKGRVESNLEEVGVEEMVDKGSEGDDERDEDDEHGLDEWGVWSRLNTS